MEFNLKKILKSLLYSTSEPLSIKDVQSVIKRFHNEAEKLNDEDEDVTIAEGEQSIMQDLIAQVPTLLTATQIRDCMEEITRELEENNEVICLIHSHKGYRITCSPDYADWVRLLREQPRPMRLSQAAMETLSIIAYRQPVTRAEIESIRGVSADSAMNRLLEHEFIMVSGRADLPGRPIQYSTTEQFLEYIGIRSTDELPASDVLSPRQITDWIRQAKEDTLTDNDLGLPEEELIPKDSPEEASEDSSEKPDEEVSEVPAEDVPEKAPEESTEDITEKPDEEVSEKIPEPPYEDSPESITSD